MPKQVDKIGEILIKLYNDGYEYEEILGGGNIVEIVSQARQALKDEALKALPKYIKSTGYTEAEIGWNNCVADTRQAIEKLFGGEKI